MNSRLRAGCVLAAVMTASLSVAQGAEGPRFADYPVATIYRGAAKTPDFRSDAMAARYRTRVLGGIGSGPNFAGGYAIITVGCGAACRLSMVADLATGRMFKFPLGGEAYPDLDLRYQVSSSLVLAAWDDGGTCFREGFKLEGRSFVSLGRRSTPQPKDGLCN
jgi:hypothetical protein